MRNFVHMGKRNPLRGTWLNFACEYRFPGPNHVCNFWWRSVKGFGPWAWQGVEFPVSPLTCVVALYIICNMYDMNENCLTHFNQKRKLIFVAASSGQTVMNCYMTLAKIWLQLIKLLTMIYYQHVQSQQYDTIRHCYLFSISLYLWFILAQRSQLLNRRIEPCLHLVI